MRIASLVPSGTAIVLALGLRADLVAVTDGCGVGGLPVVVRSSIDSERLEAAEIDRLVTAAARAGTSPYQVDEELLRAVRPDVVLTQDTCAVCALPGDIARVAAAPAARVVSLSPRGLADVLASIEAVAAAAGAEARGRSLVDGLRARQRAMATRLAGAAPVPVTCLEWLDPPFNAGHWMPELVRAAGGVDPLAEDGAMSRRLTWPDVFAAAARGVRTAVCLPCSLGLSRAATEADAIRWPGGWTVWAVDGGRLFSGAGPALWDGLEVLAAMLHPEAFPGAPPPALARRVR